MEIGTKVTFSAAHRLTFHQGKCKNLHGHNWKVEVQIHSDGWVNMVLDFGLIKEFVREQLDHTILVYEQDDILMERTEGMRRTVLPFETTAENLATFLKSKIEDAMIELPGSDDKAEVVVTVYESDESFASAI